MQIYFHSRLWSYLPRVPILVEDTVHVVGLDYLTSLYNYSSPIVENEWNCSSGDL